MYHTEQENFWAGEFGNAYVERNQGEQMLASNLALFSEALRHSQPIHSMIEFGANRGMNLKALQSLFPNIKQNAIEINDKAVAELSKVIPSQHIFHDSILEWQSESQWDLTLIKGVLIHINPDELPNVYQKLVDSTRQYLLVVEYYNPSPMMVSYRGHTERLYKRDFAGEIMASYPNMKLINYGFFYKGDPNFPQDDLTYFLLEKQPMEKQPMEKQA